MLSIRFCIPLTLLRYFLIATFSIFSCHAQDDDQALPDMLKEQLTKAIDAFNKKDFDESEKICAEILKKDPNHADTLNLVGSLHVETRDFEKARESYTKAYKIKPNLYTEFNIAELDFLEKNWIDAGKRFNKILDDPAASDLVKSVVRFKLSIMALEMKDQKSLTLHKMFFKEAGMNRELDFLALAQKIKNEKNAVGEAKTLYEPLVRKYSDTEPFFDTIMETYFQEELEK
jgi:tetratricopeptide (TPR) repeat protein